MGTKSFLILLMIRGFLFYITLWLNAKQRFFFLQTGLFSFYYFVLFVVFIFYSGNFSWLYIHD